MKKNQAVYFKYLLGNKYIYNCAICRRAAHKAIGAIFYCFIFYSIFLAIELFYFYYLILI